MYIARAITIADYENTENPLFFYFPPQESRWMIASSAETFNPALQDKFCLSLSYNLEDEVICNRICNCTIDVSMQRTILMIAGFLQEHVWIIYFYRSFTC